MQRKFMIQTSTYAGIGDQLGTQFSTLYKLGIALGYTYIHGVPFQFHRSDRPSYPIRIRRKLIAATQKITGVTLSSRFHSRDLAEFLGVNNLDLSIQNADNSHIKILDVKLDEIIQNPSIRKLFDLQAAIGQNAFRSSSEEVILLFNWTSGMHCYLPKFYQMLAEADRVSNADVNLFFSQRYWAVRNNWKISLPFDKSNSKLKVVLHIRLGDSTTVEIDGRKFYIHGSKVCSESEFSSILAIDPTRSHINDISVYKVFLDHLFAEYGEDNFHCIVLSDGYEATFRSIRNAHEEGRIELNQQSLRQLHTLRRELDTRLFNQFTQYKNTSVIIGENNLNLYKSIHSLASSDIIVYGTGGFAFLLHHLLKKPEKFTLSINIKNYDQGAFEAIGQMMPA